VTVGTSVYQLNQMLRMFFDKAYESREVRGIGSGSGDGPRWRAGPRMSGSDGGRFPLGVRHEGAWPTWNGIVGFLRIAHVQPECSWLRNLALALRLVSEDLDKA
jgi:hypothetical protein